MADKDQILSNKDVQVLAKTQNEFARDIYTAISQEKGNMFFSPFSISTALAMVHAGAKENTKSQMSKIMHLSGDEATTKEAFKDLLISLKRKAVLAMGHACTKGNTKAPMCDMHLPADKETKNKSFQDLLTNLKEESTEYELRSSNSVYISDKLAIHDSFISVLTDFFLSSSKLVDFANSEAVRKEINDVVEKETNSKIKDLFPTGVLCADTRMVLVNAIYFKGLWKIPFGGGNTKRRPFWTTAKTSSEVDMMELKDEEFRTCYLRDFDARLLALDYKGGRVSTFIILPNKRDGLKSLEEKFASESLEKFDLGMWLEEVDIAIPKFKLEETLQLVPILESMGMTDLFDRRVADLSGVSTDPLFVDAVIHKAFLEVDEEGSEAAAATGCRMMLLSGPSPKPAPFVADHPFLFFIKDNWSKQVLFMGRLQNPSTV